MGSTELNLGPQQARFDTTKNPTESAHSNVANQATDLMVVDVARQMNAKALYLGLSQCMPPLVDEVDPQ